GDHRDRARDVVLSSSRTAAGLLQEESAEVSGIRQGLRQATSARAALGKRGRPREDVSLPVSASVPVRTQRSPIIPERDGDPSFQRPYVPSETGPLSEILGCAKALGIPWKRILLAEIEAEQRLRRYLPDMQTDFSLLSAIPILSFSLLRSWR